MSVHAQDLNELSLEELLNVTIESVSKKAESLQDVSSAIYVLNAEDLRRAGVIRIQDALRLVPGYWASDMSWGFASNGLRESATMYSQSVLVLLDGVPITSPVTGGLYYQGFDIDFSEIDRIEIIRGPGGTIYGANAATGIISLYTKHGEQAQGLRAGLDGGSNGYLSPSLHLGKALGEKTWLNGWVRWRGHDGYGKNADFAGDSVSWQGSGLSGKVWNPFQDEEEGRTESLTLGLNLEHEISSSMKLGLGAFFRDNTIRNYSRVSWGWPATPGPLRPDSIWMTDAFNNLLAVHGRLDWNLSDTHALFANLHSSRQELYSDNTSIVNQTELELQDNLTLGRHALSLGANMRLVGIEVSDYPVSKSQWVLTPATGLYFVKDKTDETLSGAFLQDRVTFTDQFDLTLGAKAEDWTLLDSGAEISPSLRLRYRPVEGTTLWAAASRSITTPGYAQSSIEIPIFQMPPAWFYQMQGLTPPPTAGLWMSILSQPDVKPTEYQTLEFGLRRPLTQTLNLDLSTYYTQMDDRIDAEPVNGLLPSSLDPTQLVMPYLYSNIFKGTMFGGELVMRWLPFHGLRSEFSYSLYRSFLKGKNGIADPNPDYPNSPEHVFRTRQYWDPMPGLEVSGNLTWTSPYNRGSYNYNSLNGLTFGTPGSETKDKPANRVILDLQVAKTMLEDQLSVGVWGHDLLAGDLLDVYNAGPGLLTPTRLSPTFGANLSWKF